MGDLVGSLISGGLGLAGASMQQDAADNSSQSQAEAARIAAEASAFRPTGITTRFGKSGFNYDAQGNLQGAGYQVAPDLAAMREGMLGLAGGSLSQAQNAAQLQPYLNSDATRIYGLGAGMLPQNMNLNVSPESQQYANQLREQSFMAAPQSYNTNPTQQAQSYANQLSGIAGSAMPTNFNPNATAEAQTAGSYLQNEAQRVAPTDYSGRATHEATGLYSQLTGMSHQVMPTNYDPTARAQEYMKQQQALLAPGREQQLARTRNDLQQSGRAGLAFGATQAGNMAATNPEMAAYYNAMAQQDAQLAANSQTAARGELQSDINLAQNLGTTGLNALTTSQQQALQNSMARGQMSSNLMTQGYDVGNQSQQQQLQNALSKGGFATGLMGTGFNATTQSGQQQLQNSMALGQYSTGLAGTALSAQQYADQLARQNRQSDINTGLGLMGSGINTLSQGYGLQTAALAPWQSYLQGASTVEGMGQGALDMSSALGAKSSTAGANQAQYLAKTGMPYTGSAIGSGLMGLANNSNFTNALGGYFGTPSNSQVATQYGTNPGSQQTNMLWNQMYG